VAICSRVVSSKEPKYKNGDLVIVQAIYKEQGRLFTSDKKFLEDEIKIFSPEIKFLMQVNLFCSSFL